VIAALFTTQRRCDISSFQHYLQVLHQNTLPNSSPSPSRLPTSSHNLQPSTLSSVNLRPLSSLHLHLNNIQAVKLLKPREDLSTTVVKAAAIIFR
jgi:hypothetical protein